ncbi:MAG: C13 family peptidase [Bacillota bacterium]|nr:C13 family peptidase [Bacillota bacterium]
MNIYALLICTCEADGNNFDEFWNDTALMWDVLHKPVGQNGQGIPDNNIFVFYGNTGNDFKDPQGLMTKYCYKRDPRSIDIPGLSSRNKITVTDYPANINIIKSVIDWLSQKKDIDLLFVWTFGHGFRDETNCSLIFENGSLYTDCDFANDIGKIDSKSRIICMQQCFSGGFIDNLMQDSRNVILTSCSDSAFSFPYDGRNVDTDGKATYSHGEFNYYLYEALNSSSHFNTKDLTPGDHKELCNRMYHKVYKYIKDHDDIEEEATQYYDCFNKWCIGKTVPVDYLRSFSSIGSHYTDKTDPDPVFEFRFPITEIYKQDDHKQIYMFIDGVPNHVFKNNQGFNKFEYSFHKHGKFRLTGRFEADYSKKTISFIGYVIPGDEDPYCIGREPGQVMGATKSFHLVDLLGEPQHTIIVFNWT